MDELLERARRIRLLVLDVDGVMTDGRLHFGPEGEVLKVFHVRDGAGLVALRRAGVGLAIVSGRSSTAVEQRARELGIEHVRQAVADKGAELEKLYAQLDIGPADCACIGDDTADLPLFERVALAFAVADAHPSLRQHAHWITTLPGGHGAVREVCDLLLQART